MAVSELWSLYCAFTTCRELNVAAVVVVVVVVYLAIISVLRIQVTVFRFVTPSAQRCTVYVVPKRLYPQIDVRCITGWTTTALNITDCMGCARIRVRSQRYDTCVRRQLSHGVQDGMVCRSLRGRLQAAEKFAAASYF